MHLREIASETFKIEAEAILNLQNLLTDSFEEAVKLIVSIKGKVIVSGIGKSGLVGAKMSATFASTGTPSFFLHPVEALHGDLGMITKDDLILAISYSGNTDELLQIIPFLVMQNIPIIAITGNSQSLLAQNSTCHLNVAVKKEACPLNLAPTSSTTATLVMGDALAVALIDIRNFQREDFAFYHPGGSLGFQLLTKAKDVMRIENLPIVKPETKISDAIIKISETKIGIVVVMQNSKLLGIVTDGDIRRAMQQYAEHIFQLSVAEIITKNPISVQTETKIIEAQNIMQKHNIHILLVLDENKKLAGILEHSKTIK